MNAANESSRTTLSAGSTIRQYKVIRQLGAGGMGEVWLAQDTRLDRQVALKTLNKKGATDPDFRRRFITEARAAARITHPNVCAVYAIEELDDLVFLSIEYVEGKTLKDILRDSGLSQQKLKKIILQICEGLQAAHDQGIVHRDIKPSNIMVDTSDRVRIMDFGLAKILEAADHTTSGLLIGTVQYMSPEQVRSLPVDHRTDIYSLGVVMYELVGGRVPFRKAEQLATLYSIVNDDPEPLPTPAWWTIIAQALHKDPNQRYSDLHELAALIREIEGDVSAVGGQDITRSIAGPSRLTGGSQRSQSSHSYRRPHEKSVAVFPFRSIGPSGDNDYFADGITEEIIVKLSKIKSLKVASRTAVFRFKGTEFDFVEVAEKLGVRTFLEGSVRVMDKHIRVTATLCSAEDGFQIWSSEYDRELWDILSLQSEIATEIAQALNLQLTGAEEKTIARHRTHNVEAYDYYLRGKFHLKERSRKGIELAIQYFTEAIGLDPGFVSAIAQLSIAYGTYEAYGYDTTGYHVEKSRQLALQAVEINPESAEARMALGVTMRATNTEKSLNELKTAARLDPDNAEVMHYLAMSNMFYGLYNSALQCEKRVLTLDPFYEISRGVIFRIHFLLGNEVELVADLQSGSGIGGASGINPHHIGWMYWHKRQWKEAIEQFEKALLISPKSYHLLDYLTDCYRRVGDFNRALDTIAEAEKLHLDEHLIHARAGQVLATAGRKNDAAAKFSLSRRSLESEKGRYGGEETAQWHWAAAYVAALSSETERAAEHLIAAIDKGYGSYRELQLRPDWEDIQAISMFADRVIRLEEQRRSIDSF